MKKQKLVINKNEFHLLPDKSIYWKEKKSIIIADPHFGKTASFRSAGLAIPGGATTNDLNRLTKIISQTKAKQLIILGDFIHAKSGMAEKTLLALSGWRKNNSFLKIILIRGNHDKSAGRLSINLDLEIVEEPYQIETFLFCHYPIVSESSFTFAGHVHPAINLFGKGRLRENLPCFIISKNCITLPSFGSFTGGFIVKPEKDDEVFVIADDEVIKL